MMQPLSEKNLHKELSLTRRPPQFPQLVNKFFQMQNRNAIECGPAEQQKQMVPIRSLCRRRNLYEPHRRGRFDLYVSKEMETELIKRFFQPIIINVLEAKKHSARGRVFMSMHAYKLALKEFKRAIKNNRLEGKYLTKRAICYLKLGKNEKCIRDCTHALNLNPLDGAAYSIRMLAYENLGNEEAALKDARAAQSLNIPKQKCIMPAMMAIQEAELSKPKERVAAAFSEQAREQFLPQSPKYRPRKPRKSPPQEGFKESVPNCFPISTQTSEPFQKIFADSYAVGTQTEEGFHAESLKDPDQQSSQADFPESRKDSYPLGSRSQETFNESLEGSYPIRSSPVEAVNEVLLDSYPLRPPSEVSFDESMRSPSPQAFHESFGDLYPNRTASEETFNDSLDFAVFDQIYMDSYSSPSGIDFSCHFDSSSMNPLDNTSKTSIDVLAASSEDILETALKLNESPSNQIDNNGYPMDGVYEGDSW